MNMDEAEIVRRIKGKKWDVRVQRQNLSAMAVASATRLDWGCGASPKFACAFSCVVSARMPMTFAAFP